MAFVATPTNMTAVLVAVLAVVSIMMLMRKKYHSNIPLLFYAVAIFFANVFGRPVEPAIIYGGFAFVLLLRFEFMGAGFSKFIAFCANLGLCTMIYVLLAEVGHY